MSTKRYRCWAEVDLDALRSNLSWMRRKVGPGCGIMTVVKADAYGHGLKQIAALLMQSGTDVFGVANLAEAQSIRSVGRGWPILMLGPCLPMEVETAVRDGVMPTISCKEEAVEFAESARRLGKIVRVHVKVDTGMGRLGCRPELAPELIGHVRARPELRWEGLYTHYAAVEDDTEYTRWQLHRFESLLQKLRAAGLNPPAIHVNNSGGVLLEPRSNYDLVRPGLIVYGVAPKGRRKAGAAQNKELQPALSFKCQIGFVKESPRGTSVSYGRTYVAPRRMKLATLTAGYGDGYPRAGSNQSSVLIGGRRCPVVGRITMDQTVVDVSSVTNAQPGDEAVLIGCQGDEKITAADLAAWCGAIPWEVLTGITYRVPRIYRGGQAA